MHLHAYRLLTDTHAKKKARKLIEIIELMGFQIKLSQAHELVARIMGYDNWTELQHTTKDDPQRGVPDQMLPAKIAAIRRGFQIPLLVEALGIDEWEANGLLNALAPTADGAGRDVSILHRLGLRLSDEDIAWLDESMHLVREFDNTVRPLYTIASTRNNGLTHVRLENLQMGRRQLHNRRATVPDDIVEWVARTFPEDAPLQGEALRTVIKRAEEAHRVFSHLDARIRALGSAPMIAPVDWTFMMLYRAHVGAGEKSYYTALCPEPWLHIGFDLPHFCFNPENEWSASRALTLQLALRREFLDAGWDGQGPEWVVTFRDGNSSKEDIMVPGRSAAAAFAWAAAARGALRIAKQQTVSPISLVSLVGPMGPEDVEVALAGAFDEPIVRRGRLISGSKLKVRSQRKAA